jgi:hypothetical protein
MNRLWERSTAGVQVVGGFHLHPGCGELTPRSPGSLE